MSHPVTKGPVETLQRMAWTREPSVVVDIAWPRYHEFTMLHWEKRVSGRDLPVKGVKRGVAHCATVLLSGRLDQRFSSL